MKLTVVPHTHWDREWYEPFEEFRRRLVPVVDEVLELAAAGYPYFHLDGQTALVDDYLELRPEREGELREHAVAGRISLGPWLTLVDEFLVSGETIIRDLELGLARTRELGAAGRPVGYLPDQFGHIGQMPQLLRAAGIENAVVWRGVPASVDRSVFRWSGPDGSEVLAEYLPFGYSLGMWLREEDDPEAIARRLTETAEQLEPFAARERVLVLAGSDHQPPDPSLPDRLRATGLDVRVGSLEEHLAEPTLGELPAWTGELRSAARAHMLPNVVSARIDQKQERAEVEALLERYAEPLAALVPGFDWPGRELERAWRLLILNGAHDSVCGCSVDEVARAVDERCAEARAIAQGIVDAALGSLAAQVSGNGALRFNPSPFEREGVPGLGWAVGSDPRDEAEETELDGIELEAERDLGDLYNFDPGGAIDPPEVRVQATRRAEEPFVRLDVTIRNERPDQRVRLRIPLPKTATGSLAVSPFELVERPFVAEGSEKEAPSRTWPARGAVLAGGLAVLALGLIEYEASERELAITLLRCVGTISRSRLSTRPGSAGPDVATPEAQMLGETRLALGIVPRAKAADLLPAWERFALPLLTAQAAGGGRLPDRGSLLDVQGAELSAVRSRGDELEVRLWNPAKESITARVEGREHELGPARIETFRLPRLDDDPVDLGRRDG